MNGLLGGNDVPYWYQMGLLDDQANRQKLAQEMTHWTPQAANPSPSVVDQIGSHLASAPVGQYYNAYKTGGPAGVTLQAYKDAKYIVDELSKPFPKLPVGQDGKLGLNPDDPQMRQIMETALNFAPIGMIAYHGSPHKFGKFKMDKIGTGEGAQAYGHGLYFAENPGVAKSYKFAGNPSFLGKEHYDIAKKAIDETGGDISKARFVLHEQAMKLPQNQRQRYFTALNNIDELVGKGGDWSGNLYKVDISDDAAKNFLDWDKPLSQQPESVRKALDKLLDYAPDKEITKYMLNEQRNVGGALYGGIASQFGESASGVPSQKASELLRKVGIQGIRYLDQGSRQVGKGTSNFVLFDDDIVKILNRE